MSGQGEPWVRAATSQEAAFHSFALESSHMIGYVVRVGTSRPLEEEDVRSALCILQKKTPTLRLVFAKRDDELWLKQTSKEIDFQVIHDADVKECYMQVIKQRFKDDGPLWAAKFLPWSPSQADWVDATKMEDVEEEGNQPQVPHISHVILSFHHGITDGYSCVRIIGHFLRFLNEILAGNTDLDSEQVAQVIGVDEQNRVRTEVENMFRSDNQLLEERIKLLEKFSTYTLIEKVYPCASGLEESVEILMHCVDRATTALFRSRCKAEGVTVHAAFCTVIHAALVNIISGHTDSQEIDVPSNHALNARRYYSDDSKTAYGLGMKGFGTVARVPIDILDNFWTHAKKFHEELVYSNQIKAGFHAEVITHLTGDKSLPELLTHTAGSPLPKMRYYVTSNMMDVTPILGNVGNNVKLLFYDGCTYMPRFPALFLASFQTLRGQLMHSMQYNAQFLNPDAAKKLSDTIFQIFDKIAK